MEPEIYKDITGYEGLYQVSNYGNIKSLHFNRCKIMKLLTDKDGYKFIILNNCGSKRYKVHRLVGQEFIPNPNNYPIINHKDRNPANNYYKNLEWCTYSYNNNYDGALEKRIAQISKPVSQFDINGNFIRKWNSGSEAARVLNCAASNINLRCHNEKGILANSIWRFWLPEHKKGFKLDISNINTNGVPPLKAIAQFDLEGNWIKNWPSAMSIEKELNINHSRIAACCRGKEYSFKGYLWLYVNKEFKEDYNLFNIDINEIKDKTVLQFDIISNNLITSYPNVLIAFKQVTICGINGWQRIYLCCKGLIYSAFGYKWQFSKNQICISEGMV